MSGPGVSPGEPLVEAMLDPPMSGGGHVNPQPAQTRRTHENQQSGFGISPGRQILETLPDQRSTGETIEVHAGIIAAIGGPCPAIAPLKSAPAPG